MSIGREIGENLKPQISKEKSKRHGNLNIVKNQLVLIIARWN